jgi:hypothetical protein
LPLPYLFIYKTQAILIQQTSYKEDLRRYPNYNKVMYHEQPTATTEMLLEFIPPPRWRGGLKAYARAEEPHRNVSVVARMVMPTREACTGDRTMLVKTSPEINRAQTMILGVDGRVQPSPEVELRGEGEPGHATVEWVREKTAVVEQGKNVLKRLTMSSSPPQMEIETSEQPSGHYSGRANLPWSQRGKGSCGRKSLMRSTMAKATHPEEAGASEQPKGN